MSMNVTIIDRSDLVGKAASAFRAGELYMTDVQSMLDNVINHVKSKHTTIRGLFIIDHGNTQTIQIGSDKLRQDNLWFYKKSLGRLAKHFDSTDGYVWLQHCSIGQNKPLLLSLAEIFGVPVYAGKQFSNVVYRVNWPVKWVGFIPVPIVTKPRQWEDYVRADPNGDFRDSGRPSMDRFVGRTETIRRQTTRLLDGWTVSFSED